MSLQRCTGDVLRDNNVELGVNLAGASQTVRTAWTTNECEALLHDKWVQGEGKCFSRGRCPCDGTKRGKRISEMFERDSTGITRATFGAVMDCVVSHIADAELPGAEQSFPSDQRALGAADGGSSSGRLMYCLGKHGGIINAAMYFLGYACQGGENGQHHTCTRSKRWRMTGAHSLTYGMDAGISSNDWRLFIPEGNELRCRAGQRSLRDSVGLVGKSLGRLGPRWKTKHEHNNRTMQSASSATNGNVTIWCGMVPDDKEWVISNVCPTGSSHSRSPNKPYPNPTLTPTECHCGLPGDLDLWATDFDVDAIEHLFHHVVTNCNPKLIFIENSGQYTWRKGAWWDDFNNNFLQKSRVGKMGDGMRERYEVLVDTAPSTLALLGDSAGDNRRHSLLMRAPKNAKASRRRLNVEMISSTQQIEHK